MGGTEDVAHVLAGVAVSEHAVHGVTQEVWVSSTTSAIRTMSPRRAQPTIISTPDSGILWPGHE